MTDDGEYGRVNQRSPADTPSRLGIDQSGLAAEVLRHEFGDRVIDSLAAFVIEVIVISLLDDERRYRCLGRAGQSLEHGERNQ